MQSKTFHISFKYDFYKIIKLNLLYSWLIPYWIFLETYLSNKLIENNYPISTNH